MRALHKSKRVSWPPDFKLCQVRLFISEDSPSQVGSESQDHFQAISSGAAHLSDDNLPPGFGGLLSPNESIKLSDIPVIKWQCSVQILLDDEWKMVAGDESKEAEAQNQRELRVLEAFYPGASSIPPNPSVPADVDTSDYDDQQTLVIPILVVEDDDVAADTASELPTQSGVDVGTVPSITNENTSTSSSLPAASEIMAALAALSNSKEQGGSMIDKYLLIKILSNPKMVENLVANCGSSAASVSSNATHETNGVVATATTPACSNGQYNPQPAVSHIPPPIVYPRQVPSDQSNYGAPPPPARDASYYQSLIQQHGGERQEAPPLPVQQHLGGYRYSLQPGAGGGGPNPEIVNSNRPRDSKPKIMKPCMYFNTSRGCRNGANCLFQHDATAAYQPRNVNNNRNINNNPEMQSAKRMRFDRV
ncbi:zinc finger CCCH domain-containing protein 6 [Brassica napus]|uniref:zinc finger CCCH domain-containing protein 6 n=1 Tax=Brassica napus TaxID=3708 RepID=UPI00207A6328|nr:zinc finger CCCH domain-containing protein 6 [Brassica napus]